MHDVLNYYSISIFYYCKTIKERSKKSAWCPPSYQTCPQATSWYNLSSLLAIDHRTTSFLGCFHLHVKKNKQPCLVVINYSKYLQYFEGQINKVFRPCLLDCWLHSGSKKFIENTYCCLQMILRPIIKKTVSVSSVMGIQSISRKIV